MKKILSVLLSVCLLSISLVSVSAEEKVTYDDYMICNSADEVYELYLKNHNATDRSDLSNDQNNELCLLIEEYKSLKYGNDLTTINSRERLSDYTGGIFIHFDSQSGSWAHGHAAIGYGHGTVEIVDYNSTVQQHGSSRLERWYSAKTGGFYTVKGANASLNQNAANNAYAKIGTGYWIIGDTGEFGGYTCSGLVAVSWGEAGINLGGRLATPNSLSTNANTVLQFLWKDVEY